MASVVTTPKADTLIPKHNNKRIGQIYSNAALIGIGEVYLASFSFLASRNKIDGNKIMGLGYGAATCAFIYFCAWEIFKSKAKNSKYKGDNSTAFFCLSVAYASYVMAKYNFGAATNHNNTRVFGNNFAGLHVALASSVASALIAGIFIKKRKLTLKTSFFSASNNWLGLGYNF